MTNAITYERDPDAITTDDTLSVMELTLDAFAVAWNDAITTPLAWQAVR